MKENWHRAAVIHLRSVLFDSGQKRYLDLVSEIRYWWPNFVFLYRWCKPMYRPVLLLNTYYRKYTGRPVWDHFEEQRPLVGYKAISVSIRLQWHSPDTPTFCLCVTCICIAGNVYYQCESVCVRTACMCHLFMYEALGELVTLCWTWLHSHSVGITESLLAPLANYSWVACRLSFPMALVHMHRSARDACPSQARLQGNSV